MIAWISDALIDLYKRPLKEPRSYELQTWDWNPALKTWHALVMTTQRTTQNLKILRDEMVFVCSKVARTSIVT